MERLRCVVERLTYVNEDNGYTVLKARVKNYKDLVTVVGKLASVHVGSVLTVMGEWKLDRKFGRQFAASQWEESLPASVLGIEKYLGSGMIKGVGPKYARRIVEKFGAETLTVIEDTPDRLIEVDGIGGKRVAMIKKAWADQKEVKNIMIFLQGHDVSSTHAVKIYKHYGNDSIAVVKENPYKLADDIWGVGFKTADQIAQKMGFDRESYYRCRSGIFYILNEFSSDGHCYAPREALVEKAAEMLEIDAEKISTAMDQMLNDKDLVCEPPDMIYLMPLFFSEKGAAHRLRTIMNTPRRAAEVDIEVSIADAERASRIKYDDIQRDAIRTASQSKVMVLTGGPGTGKTTCTKGILSAFRARGLRILLAAPTGRAAKRLSETTRMEAKTIHRLLESKPPDGYARNAEHPLEGDVLIVDEASMIDVVLFYNLLKAVPDEMTVVIVGDADQLPSVGPGNVLRDVIASEAAPVVRLTRIYRQARASQIVMNAHRINSGGFPNLNTGKNSDFFFIEENDTEKIPDLICDLCARRLPGYYKVDPIQGVQVLTPMQRGETGAANLNALLQGALNPSEEYLYRGGAQYRRGDKVMQIKNNYEKSVMNGDVGIVTAVDQEERELTVAFDGEKTTYDISELDELVLAYATTVHKAQGSEYPVVVMPFTTQHYMMLQKNLLYTGVTRAKKVFVLVGTKKAVGCAVSNNKVTERNTLLAERLRKSSE